MCDYSLEAYRSQPAVTGERYVLDQFSSGSKGFTSKLGCGTAVCMAADAKLRLEGISPALQMSHDLESTEEVTMVRRETGPHHDAVRFRNGHELLLQVLDRGVTATVLPAQLEDALKIGAAGRELLPA